MQTRILTTRGEEMSSTIVKGSIKDFFVYLGSALVLYTSLSALTFLCFSYIDLFFAESPEYPRIYQLDSIRWQVSLLVILFPLFLGLSYLINKDIQRDATKLEIRSRKWLLYSVMFVTSVSGVVDLAYLVHNFLGGGLAQEFLLKALTVLFISGAAFTYYYQELKRGVSVSTGNRVFSGLISVAITAVLAFGFYTVGSPATQRQHRQDEQRIADLSQIKDRVVHYFHAQNNLPENLKKLVGDGFLSLPKDPDNSESYEYTVLDVNSFQLCANFKTERMDGDRSFYLVRDWAYHPGRNCFLSKVEQAAK